MSRTAAFTTVLTLAIASGAVVLVGEVDQQEVDFDSVVEIWSDVLRDVDQFGLRVTRVSEEDEMELGRRLTASAPFPPMPGQVTVYVSAIGNSMVPYVRRPGIKYEFHVLDADFVNAFALPGGQVLVTRGMIDFVRSEAELAAVIGHEIAHVDARHCIERHQYALRLAQSGLRELAGPADMAHALFAAGYTKYQESEADAQGLRMAIQAGYDPEAPAVFERMRGAFGEPQAGPSRNPISEVARATAETAGSYFRSHPPSVRRARQLDAQIARWHGRLTGRELYVGVENHRLRVAHSQRRLPNETRRY